MRPSIVCIGGGTGTFVVLRGLKHYPYRLSSIVTMADSGGSNKRIRDEFGLLPTSDIRQCFVALADENGDVGLLRRLFMYRFEKGKGISGMTFGNLFMAALADILGSQKEAISQTGKVLRIKGAVIPVSFTGTNLFAEYEDGRVLREEHLIDEPSHEGTLRIKRVYLRPEAQPNPYALRAIKNAHMVVLGPGDLYTSVIPNLLVHGIPESLKQTRATVVYVMNLMTKYGQTLGFSARAHVAVLERYLGKSIDVVLVNNSKLPPKALAHYEKHQEHPVLDDLPKVAYYHVVRSDLASRSIYQKAQSDRLVRSLIRHESSTLASALVRILTKRGQP